VLSPRSDEFRVRWAAHDVGFHRTATKQMHHSLVGDLMLTFEMLDLPSDPGLSLLTYCAEPGSPSEDAMRELARWSETRTKLSAAPAGPQQPTV
jgi:MmyB-like transcription regulator ligand binding domain